jgi:CBS-domain-containing membrane protein
MRGADDSRRRDVEGIDRRSLRARLRAELLGYLSATTRDAVLVKGQGEHLIGIVSRTDLLRQLAGVLREEGD